MMVNFGVFTTEQERNFRLQVVRRIIRESMVPIDESIEKIHVKLNPNNDLDVKAQSWKMEEKINIYTTVYDIFCSAAMEGFWPYAVSQYYEKYEHTVTERISNYVIPSLEDKIGEDFIIEVAKQWTQLDEYKRNLHIIFGHVEKVAVNLSLSKPLFVDICKTKFCNMVWDKFHCEIDFSVTKMKESSSGMFSNESTPLKEELVKFFDDMEKVSNKGLKQTLHIIEEDC
ncbi:hypothetical protein CsatB_029636 [Cannabis sativa]|uniref:Cullin N-terminal domain-containing protein n=2 Tax=Cannabis sativa TaxID=3483 RepID=A0A7J6FCK9_CANSA|nr:uncharacterized protein LOC133035107 [Cannabis sativa]XP_060966816.1 uncharacterized protein LOC133035107 [Cannabis sativa]KAF4368431.1 hypothetical protein G4B88_025493 [Cannabis sativa]KAF4369689.1 hypothetical protein F8388_015776 [Cannabis sativa]